MIQDEGLPWAADGSSMAPQWCRVMADPASLDLQPALVHDMQASHHVAYKMECRTFLGPRWLHMVLMNAGTGPAEM